jgi:predicted PurR-regulated permease PerM
MTHFVAFVLNNPFTLGLMCYCLIVVPVIGIWYVHK